MLSYFVFLYVMTPTNLCLAAKLDPPSISAVTASSFTASFSSQNGTVLFSIAVVLKYGNQTKITLSNFTSGSEVPGLESDRIYLVTVKAEDADGVLVGEESDQAVLHTLPFPPKLKLKTALATSIHVFFEANYLARVSEWNIQYRKEGKGSSLKQVVGSGYMHRLSGLTPNSRYEVRARPSQLLGFQNLSEAEVDFSAWQIFTTGKLSVFGRVDMTRINGAGKIVVNSAQWNESLQILRENYEPLGVDQIRILRIEKGEGGARVHYQIKVDEKYLPSGTNYSLSNDGLENSSINSGGTAAGTPYYVGNSSSPKLLYNSLSNCRGKIIERYFIKTTKNKPTAEIHLNVASSDATTPEETDGLVVKLSDDELNYQLLRDDELPAPSIEPVPPNTVLSLTPRFLVKDCLAGGTSNNLLYSELLFATSATSMDRIYDIVTTTEAVSSMLDSYDMVYSHSKNWTYFIVEVPAIEKVVKYKIFDPEQIIGSLDETDLDSSKTWKIITSTYAPNKRYHLKASVSFRKQDGSEYTVNGSAFDVNPGGPLCDECSNDAICSIRVGDGRRSCNCLDGFIGDGSTCHLIRKTPTDHMEQWKVLLIALSILFLLVVLAVLIRRRCRKKRRGKFNIPRLHGETLALKVKPPDQRRPEQSERGVVLERTGDGCESA